MSFCPVMTSNLLRASVLLACILSRMAVAAPPAGAESPTMPKLIRFADKDGMARLDRSQHKVDFFQLVNQFESQENRGYCGPATAVIVLNTLRVNNPRAAKPKDRSLFPAEFRSRLPPGWDPDFNRYTQGTFFNDKSEPVKTRDQFFGKPKAPGAKPSPGIELRELHGVLLNHGLHSELRIADDKLTDDIIKRDLMQNLATADDYAVINYSRPVLGQPGGGHISPLGAYDLKSDSFLILDVNPNGQSWVWVPSDLLIRGMRTADVNENRGYLLIKEGAK